jgi:hypothetical protein
MHYLDVLDQLAILLGVCILPVLHADFVEQ